MSRNTVILLVALCGAIAGLIIFSKINSGGIPTTPQPMAYQPKGGSESPANNYATPVRPGGTAPGLNNQNPVGATAGANTQSLITIVPGVPPRTTQNPAVQVPTVNIDTNDLPTEAKPLPVLEKDYAAATNRDTRLDILMDIAEMPGPDSIKALTRLFEAEMDTDLKVDLLDSLLGIEGFKEEKLIMLTMGARQGLPTEVRQSAIDGLIDLDDQRVIPVLNGLLNDPNEEIREGAKDALEMIQSQPVVKFGK
jgi:hypothetical protein